MMSTDTGASQRKGTSAVVMLLAFTPLIFMRSRIGARLIARDRLIGSAVFLFCGPQLLSYVVFRTWLYVLPLAAFALVQLGLGFYHRSNHFEDIERGGSWSTYGLGVSHLQGRIRVERNEWVPRFIDPLVALLIGWIVSETISKPVGWWLMLCAVCFAIVENRAWSEAFQQDLDTHDTIVEAQEHAERAARYSSRRQPPEQSEDGSIPTGKGPDVEGRRPRRPQPPDNLA